EAIVAPFLRSRKILTVDYLILSHPRIDHYGGMTTIVREFTPREFWSAAGQGGTARFDELERTLSHAPTERLVFHAARPCRQLDEVRACFLYPPRGADRPSLVLRLEFGEASLLFAGDIEKRDEDELLRDPGGLQSRVLKVPRHGSAAASSPAFVAAVRPRLAIVSVGARNAQGLPSAEVVERYRSIGAEVLRTDQDGAVIVETDGRKLRYRTYRSGKQGTITF
ncbi:MAG TPA: hypothetical protein VNO43_15235, partial [Candidatus Eisenbacteria bacterium]|nr:hypothetical protein [Candidatus Eisenbacteria bacterium]